MKYYLIAGEASGDLHASRLIKALRESDAEAEFRFYGGDLMAAEAGVPPVRHYRELAYMGFVQVAFHLTTILRNMRQARHDIVEWQPDVLILVDYPGFNLRIARYIKAHTNIPVCYYIAPKIWAWKEWRIKSIRRDIDTLLSILPFEVEFFEGKHHYPIHYVGNPTADEVSEYLESIGANIGANASERLNSETIPTLGGVGSYRGLNSETIPTLGGVGSYAPTIVLLAGSRRQEIKANLPAMLRATRRYASDYELLVAGAPGIDDEFYAPFLNGYSARLVKGRTFELLSKAHAALVTSGTATLETALFGVPQVVCYATILPRLLGWLRKRVLSVKYVSLVNLIANREVVTELVADTFSEANIERELNKILDGEPRQKMLNGYQEVWQRLRLKSADVPTLGGVGSSSASNAARIIISLYGKKA